MAHFALRIWPSVSKAAQPIRFICATQRLRNTTEVAPAAVPEAGSFAAQAVPTSVAPEAAPVEAPVKTMSTTSSAIKLFLLNQKLNADKQAALKASNIPKSAVYVLPAAEDPLAKKFINCLMRDGKKSVAERIFYKTLTRLKGLELQRIHDNPQGPPQMDPLEIFTQAVKNAQPIVGTTPVRRGGGVQHVPSALAPTRRRTLGIKWIIAAARKKKGASMDERLSLELMDAIHFQGGAMKQKAELYKIVNANRAFAKV